jgi:DNA-binding NarL/FixJ family response regulator
MIKILLVDDHQIILDSLKLLFKSIENIDVVETTNDSREVRKLLENNTIDIVVSDLHMPFYSGIDIALMLKKDFPTVKIILLTMAEDALLIKDALRAGVHGYILKKASKLELETAIIKIGNGNKYYSEAVIDELTNSSIEEITIIKPENLEKLTQRELEVLKLITMEYSTNEITSKLFVSTATVESHRSNLMRKLQVKSAIGMVKYALRHGFVD